MVTTNSPSSSSTSSSPVQKNAVLEGEGSVPQVNEAPGFVDLLVKSIFEVSWTLRQQLTCSPERTLRLLWVGIDSS
jgi:hypothetical protein